MPGSIFFAKRYGVTANKILQLLSAGLAASLLAFVLGLILPVVGLPRLDYAGLYASVWGEGTASVFSPSWCLGLGFHLLMGSCLAVFVFDFLIEKRILPNLPHTKGLIWGGVLWVLIELTLEPLAGHGIFSSASVHPTPLALATLLTCLAYGFLFESATRVPLVHALRRRQKRLDVADCHNFPPLFPRRRSP